MPTTRPETLRLTNGRYSLTAVKWNGKWKFQCKSWPDLAAQFNGSESASEAKEEFTRRVLQTRRKKQ